MKIKPIVSLVAITMVTACSITPHPVLLPDTFTSDNFSCTEASSKVLSFSEFSHHQAAYKDRCVQVEGFTNGTLITVDAGSFGQAGPETITGLYWQAEGIAQHLRQAPSFVVVTGRLRSCEDVGQNAVAWAAAENAKPQPKDGIQTMAIPMPSGICHFGKGHALFVSNYKIIPTAMD